MRDVILSSSPACPRAFTTASTCREETSSLSLQNVQLHSTQNLESIRSFWKTEHACLMFVQHDPWD